MCCVNRPVPWQAPFSSTGDKTWSKCPTSKARQQSRLSTNRHRLQGNRNGAQITSALLLTCWLVLFLSRDVHAYVDPGTGSYLLQILLAFLFGAAFAMKLYWRRVKEFVKTRFSRNTGSPGDES